MVILWRDWDIRVCAHWHSSQDKTGTFSAYPKMRPEYLRSKRSSALIPRWDQSTCSLDGHRFLSQNETRKSTFYTVGGTHPRMRPEHLRFKRSSALIPRWAQNIYGLAAHRCLFQRWDHTSYDFDALGTFPMSNIKTHAYGLLSPYLKDQNIAVNSFMLISVRHFVQISNNFWRQWSLETTRYPRCFVYQQCIMFVIHTANAQWHMSHYVHRWNIHTITWVFRERREHHK